VERVKPSLCLGRGGSPAARGRDNIGNPNLPPNYDRLEGCEALGGLIVASSPRLFAAYGTVILYRGSVND
jgi:hypothetical protein